MAARKPNHPPKESRKPASQPARASSPRMPAIEPLALRTHDAMHALQCGETRLFELLKQGKLRSSKIGRMRLVHLDSIRQLLAETTTR
jgi:hypothetical protein